MAYEVQKLGAPHKVMVDLHLQGFKIKEIAEQMGYTPAGVSLVCASPAFQAELARRRREQERTHDNVVASTVSRARDKLAGMAEEAVDRLGDHMRSPDDRLSLMSVKEILDRAGGMEATRAPVEVQILSPEKLELLLLAVRESGRALPDLVEQAA